MQFDPIAYINEPRWQQSRLGLERIDELLRRMGRPQDRLKFVHVAGTNGKGSVCAYLESVLRAAGYRTGLFTSPYILSFCERIRVCGENISIGDLSEVTLFVREHAEAMEAETGEHPTEFELMCAVAFEHFARSCCDVVVCEVGLGGRLDSTNIIENPEACVIARIGLDHTDLLGDTPEAIAREKAGIIKPGSPVVSWPQDDSQAMGAIMSIAADRGSVVRSPDMSQLAIGPFRDGVREFSYRGEAFTTRLAGSYQPANAVLAIEVSRTMVQRGWEIPDMAVERGIADATWPGRFEIVSAGPPPVIVDGGHNPQGAAVLAESLADAFPGRRAVFVMGVLADKDYRAMIRAVKPLAKAFICASPSNPRALAAADLACAIQEETHGGVAVRQAADYRGAIRGARELASPDEVICAFGSLYAIAEIEQALER